MRLLTHTTDPSTKRLETKIAFALTIRYLAFITAFVILATLAVLVPITLFFSHHHHPGFTLTGLLLLQVAHWFLIVATIIFQIAIFRWRHGVFAPLLHGKNPDAKRYIFSHQVLKRDGSWRPSRDAFAIWWAFAWRQALLIILLELPLHLMGLAALSFVYMAIAIVLATWIAFRWVVFGKVWGRHHVLVEVAGS